MPALEVLELHQSALDAPSETSLLGGLVQRLRQLVVTQGTFADAVFKELEGHVPVEIVEGRSVSGLEREVVFKGECDGDSGGESGKLTLRPLAGAQLEFELSWSGWWSSGDSADGDLYQLEGQLCEVEEGVFLMIPELEGGHMDLVWECYPYLLMNMPTVHIHHPINDVAMNYHGPFGMTLVLDQAPV